MTRDQIEDTIKHDLIPYNSFLKMTFSGDNPDREPMIPDNRIPKDYDWAILIAHCEQESE